MIFREAQLRGEAVFFRETVEGKSPSLVELMLKPTHSGPFEPQNHI